MNAYEAKQESRRARLMSAASAALSRAESAGGRARTIAGRFEFGQPILVGHHSENRARRDQRRMHDSMSRAVAEQKRAADLQRRADAVGSGGISSDDPEAVQKLAIELDKAKRDQERNKAINVAIRKNAKRGADAQAAAIVALGVPESIARELLKPDFAGRIGIAPYQISNLGANIRRIEKRIAELRAKSATPARETIETDRYTISESAEDNRTRIEFAARQSAPIVAALKSHGFRWSPTIGAWQRMRSNGAWWAATQIGAMVDRAAAEVMP